MSKVESLGRLVGAVAVSNPVLYTYLVTHLHILHLIPVGLSNQLSILLQPTSLVTSDTLSFIIKFGIRETFLYKITNKFTKKSFVNLPGVFVNTPFLDPS